MALWYSRARASTRQKRSTARTSRSATSQGARSWTQAMTSWAAWLMRKAEVAPCFSAALLPGPNGGHE